ncbi:MAG: hypothetical protein KDK90_25770 [Leptospiraceae bacterium]|nr:hypothetical protein [Leptospiraceae bacterium]
MSLFIGDIVESKKLAKAVIELINKENDEDYWSLATLGEAYLLLGEKEKAIDAYSKAVKKEKTHFGNINSSYHQIMLISKFTQIEVPAEILDILKPPCIIAFSGHMIDHPNRKTPRFPAYIESSVKEELGKVIKELNPKIVYTSAACGSDILFIETLLEQNQDDMEINVYLPFSKDDFIKTSVSFAGEKWEERFLNILNKVSPKYVTEESYFGNDELFSFTGDLMIGISIIRSMTLLTKPFFLGVMDMEDVSKKFAGTSDILSRWPYQDTIKIIDISKIQKNKQNNSSEQQHNEDYMHKQAIPFGIQREIKYILFADIVGFSKMREEQTPYFVFELLKVISEGIEKLTIQPKVLNTWGDAIFATFNKASDMIEFALVINNIIQKTNWTERHLPKDTNIRIALHAGPVFNGIDPITKKDNAYGSHINRAARMEPVTAHGQIYASEQFAAALYVEKGDMYKYEYIGKIKLAKDFGYQETYSITKVK